MSSTRPCARSEIAAYYLRPRTVCLAWAADTPDTWTGRHARAWRVAAAELKVHVGLAIRRTVNASGSAASGRVGGARHLRCSGPHGPGAHPQLLDHRPHRPRQVDARRSHPRADAHGRCARDARAAARLDGPRARAGHHDQGAGGARVLHGARRRDLPAAPDRHAGARRLHLRGLALAGRVRGRAAGGRRLPGGRGADGRQHLPGGRVGARADPVPEQDRPAGRRARARGGRSRAS